MLILYEAHPGRCDQNDLKKSLLHLAIKTFTTEAEIIKVISLLFNNIPNPKYPAKVIN